MWRVSSGFEAVLLGACPGRRAKGVNTSPASAELLESSPEAPPLSTAAVDPRLLRVWLIERSKSCIDRTPPGVRFESLFAARFPFPFLIAILRCLAVGTIAGRLALVRRDDRVEF